MFSKLKAISKALAEQPFTQNGGSPVPLGLEPPPYCYDADPSSEGEKSTTFNLVELPPELRSQIFEHHFRGCSARFKYDGTDDGDEGPFHRIFFKLELPAATALLWTCHQLYNEAIVIYRRLVTIDLVGLAPGAMIDFSAQRSWNPLGQMRNLKIELGVLYWNMTFMKRSFAPLCEAGATLLRRIIVEARTKPKSKTFRFQEEFNMSRFFDLWRQLEHVKEFEYETEVREDIVPFEQMVEWAMVIKETMQMKDKLSFCKSGKGRFSMILFKEADRPPT